MQGLVVNETAWFQPSLRKALREAVEELESQGTISVCFLPSATSLSAILSISWGHQGQAYLIVLPVLYSCAFLLRPIPGTILT